MVTDVSDGAAPPVVPVSDLSADLVEVQPASPAGGKVDAETRNRLRNALRILLAARRRDDRGSDADGP